MIFSHFYPPWREARETSSISYTGPGFCFPDSGYQLVGPQLPLHWSAANFDQRPEERNLDGAGSIRITKSRVRRNVKVATERLMNNLGLQVVP